MICVLAIGDVVGKEGCSFLRKHLPELRRKYLVDMVVANGENSAVGNGILPTSAEHLFASGVDVITTGNHVYKRREIYPYLDEHPLLSVRQIIRRAVTEKDIVFLCRKL